MTRYLCLVAMTALIFGCSNTPGGGGGGVGADVSVGDDATTNNGGGGSGFQSGEALGVEVTPDLVSFGVVSIGDVETRTVEIFHSGTSGTLVLSRIDYVVDWGSDLSLDPPEVTSLGVGETTALTLRYAPTDAERDLGTLVIETNALDAEGAQISFAIPVEATELSSQVEMGSSIVNFGSVATATTASQTVVVLNLGSLDVSIEELLIDGENAAEFTVTPAAALPLLVAPGSQVPLEVSYTPVVQSTDTAALHVQFTAIDGAGESVVPLFGSGVSAVFEAEPDPLDFGLRSPGAGHVETIVVTSGHNDVPLQIASVSVVETGEWSGTVTVAPLADEGAVVGVDESLAVEVTFTPTEDMVSGATPVAEIAFATNDPTSDGVQTVFVYGQRGGTGLEVFPPDIVYFGYIGCRGDRVP